MGKRLMMELPHGCKDPLKTYAMPDPDVLAKAYERVHQAVYPFVGQMDLSKVEGGDMRQVLTLADIYLLMTTDAGQEYWVEKLRDVWRARRARIDGEGE